MKTGKLLPLLVIVFLAFVPAISCKNTSVTATAPANLVGAPWNVVTVNGTKLDKNTSISLIFLNDGTFTGDLLCNNYGGKYAAGDNNSLKMTDMMMTLVICEKGNQQQGDKYMQILSSVSTYKISGNSLVFLGKNDKELVSLRLAK